MGKPKIYRVWTRTGGKPHAAREGSDYTLCGREHMGFTGPQSGSTAPRFARHMENSTCQICVQQAHSAGAEGGSGSGEAG